jgi:hypothetical protein
MSGSNFLHPGAMLHRPWRVLGFGHSGAAGDGCVDPTNNAAIYRLAKIMTNQDGRAYVYSASGRVLVYDGLASHSVGAKGWPMLYAAAPYAAVQRKMWITPDRPGIMVFWMGAGDMLTASTASLGDAWKQALHACICRMRCHYYNNDPGTTATTGTWTSTATASDNGPSSNHWQVATSGAGATRSITISTAMATPYAGRRINAAWCINGTGTVSAVVRARVDGGSWVTKTISNWSGNMQPAVIQVVQPTSQAAALEVEVVSKDAGATVGLDWIGVEARYPPLIGIPEINNKLPTTGYNTVVSQSWPNASVYSNPAVTTEQDAFNALTDTVIAEFDAIDAPAKRVVKLPMNSVIPDNTNMDWYYTDGMHFNEAGHTLLAAAWADVFMSLFRSNYDEMNNVTGTG